MITRREALTLGARVAIGGALVTSLPGAVLALSTREEAWRLLGIAKAYHDAGDKANAIKASADVFTHLMKYLSDPKYINASDEVQDKVIAEISACIKRPKEFDEATCSDAAFSIQIVRHGLKHYHLPMVQASNWKPFAKMYTHYVMAA